MTVDDPFKDAVYDPKSPSLLKYDAKVLRGKNGRLFLDNDRNNVIKQLTGELRFTEQQLLEWRALLEARVSWLDKRGCRYFFLVAVNAHLVYPEDLPDHIRPATTRPIHQLLDHLEETESNARLIYPLDEILAAKPHPLLFPRTDTHWTGHSAYIAYRMLAREVSSVMPMYVVSEEELVFYEVPWMGDLGFKVEPKDESTTVSTSVKRPAARLISDNRVINTGLVVVTECPGAPDVRCVVFGDSSVHAMLPSLSSSFRHVVFAIGVTVDREFVREQRPDVVISLMNERLMTTVPDDAGEMTVRDQERMKKAKGLVRDRDLPHWPHLDPP
jgi:alginate O-acetyltransferase complex protein AlgJ